MNAVEIENIHKSFPGHWGKGGVYAVKGVSLSIPQGTVYGLIGPNGSGKSTIMKALVGLLAPDEGSCRVFGQPATAAANRKEIGFLPENPYFYKFLTGEETVRFYGRLCGLRGKELRNRTAEMLELAGLTDAAHRRLGGYSKGMLQRVGLAQALVQRPRLLVLDEPTAGVDPIGSRAIRDIILSLKEQGLTVFLCSHLLEQVQEICDNVGILYQGCMIAAGSMEAITRDLSTTEVSLRNPSAELLAQIQTLAGDAWLAARPARNSLESVFIRGIKAKLQEQEHAEK
ncbi:MAG: ABC transporter ATP-binding protein [Akkermansiaceae bacterium]|nr:ABC transporter ATP-binding protein [Akkermansiaceae bacterium]